MTLSMVPVSEAFGPVWQGEGPGTGQRASFLRLGLCNLSCSWCDTPYTWDRERYVLSEEMTMFGTKEIVDAITSHRTKLLVLTGGEPLIHRNNEALLGALRLLRTHMKVQVETNGTLLPGPLDELVNSWVVSPKIAQDDDLFKRRIRPAVLRAYALRDAVLKVVARDEDDLALLSALLPEWGEWKGRVWVMPEGRTADDVLANGRALADAVTAYGWNLSLRQQVLLFGDTKGT